MGLTSEQDWAIWLLFNNWYGDTIKLKDVSSKRVGELMELAFFAGYKAREKLDDGKNPMADG